MAITRAQQVRQMLEDGGMLVSPSKDGKRPGYRRSNYDTSGGGLRSKTKAPGRQDPSKFGFNPAQAAANVGKASTASPGRQDPSKFGFDAREAQKSKQYSGITPTDKDGRIIEQYEGTTETGIVDDKPIVIPKRSQRDTNKFVVPSIFNRKFLFNLSQKLPRFGAPTIKERQDAYKEYLESMGVTNIPTSLDDKDPFAFFESDAFGYEPKVRGQPQATIQNYGDFALENFGTPGIKFSGDVGNKEVFVKGYRADGSKIYGVREKRDDGPGDQILFPEGTTPGDPNQDPGDGDDGDDDNTQTGIGQAFRLMSRGGSPMDAPKKEGIMMASAPDPMDTRNEMMENLAMDNFGKPLKDLTEDEIIQIEEMMMEMDQYGSKPTSRSNKMMADLDIKSMIDDALEQMSQTRFGKSYDELDPLEKELILQIIRGVGKDVFGEKQMPESDRVMAQEGGIMDLETGRQMYFLGKLVKKATRAVKKIAKSPIGKAALAFGIPGTGFGGLFGRASLGGAAKGLFGKYGIAQTLGMKGLSPGALGGKKTGLSGLFERALGFAQDNPFLTAGSIFALLPFLTEEEKQQIASSRGVSIDPGYIRNNPYTFASNVGSGSGTAFALAADGGRIGYQEGSKEPVAKKTMPLLDLDGQEMDLRDDGGFVPIGRMEKADDVPARLSKNEFVFTADAVRNAGGGDVDKGAEVMYNMMKNLESGGEVSEESQGLEGAREMFQTSKRLEEVL